MGKGKNVLVPIQISIFTYKKLNGALALAEEVVSLFLPFLFGATHTNYSKEGGGGLDASCRAAGFTVILSRLLWLQMSQYKLLFILVYLPVQQSPIVIP